LAIGLTALLAMIAGSLTAVPASAQSAGEVDLRVLVISSGNRSEDNALELMARSMERMGVPFDIVDSRRTELTEAMLYVSPQHGRYNGIILTVSDLYQPGGGSGFTLAEWQMLHTYERTFDVRQSVVSGWPTWDPSLDLDYGMGSVGAIGGSDAVWAGPAGGTEMFEYINTANPFPVTDFSFTATPRNDGSGPTVTPLLVHPQDGSLLISHLAYADGRETMLSTISNAWYFLHSNALAYELVNFATKGLFIGSRQMHLSVHIDDLFIEDELWDPVTNVAGPGDYRMSPSDLTTALSNQNQFRAEHPLADDFLLQFAFNGIGAGNGQQILPDETYSAIADAVIRADSPTSNYGQAPTADLERSGGTDDSRLLIRFDDQLALGDPTIVSATLRLFADSPTATTHPAEVCRVTEDWTEGAGDATGTTVSDVSWNNRTGTDPWTTAGASFDATNCVAFNLNTSGGTDVNIGAVGGQALAQGERDYGIVVRLTADTTTPVTIRTGEFGAGEEAPQLTIGFPTTPADPLTSAIVANKDSFGFINHTYATRQMDRVCPEEPAPQPPLCEITNLLTVSNEISRNRTVWQPLGLPDFAEGSRYLLSDSHAGLHDRRSTEEDGSDDIAYPVGLNPNFFQGMQDLGVEYVASDSSRPGQELEAYAPGYSVFVSPRYPTAIWTNSSTPAENTDQYNWIFHERYLEAGQNPCDFPAAICVPRTWEEILDAEAELTTLHMVIGSMWPHYQHQINLRAYDGSNQLTFDWLDAVMDRYEEMIDLPVITRRPWEIGDIQKRLANARGQNVRGTLDLATNTVTLVADGAAQPTVTGLAGGSIYGGQYQSVVDVGVTPTTHAVDPALGQ